MLKQLKRLMSLPSQAVNSDAPEAVPAAPGAQMVGLKDMVLSGWMNKESGELMTGFPVSAEDTVLDIGCGEGGYALFSARRGASIILADLDAPKLEVARQRLEKAGAHKVQALITDADPIPLPDHSVSRVVAMEVLEHVDDPERFIAELVRVAKPGALLLLTVPDELNEGIQKQVAPSVYFEKPNHIRIFKRGELASLALQAGLTIEHETQYGFYHAIWWSFFWACENQPLTPPWHPLLDQWAATWATLLSLPDGLRIKQALDETLPKSQVLIARKP